MKTKIIYISGNEIFDMNDIRCAFEEVRQALNLDKDTILFGVPVDKDDAELTPNTTETHETITESVETPIIEEPEIITESAEETPEEKIIEIVEPVKKRGRPKKVETKEEVIEPQPVVEGTKTETTEPTTDDDKIIPILSILSSKDEDEEKEEETEVVEEPTETEEIIEEEIINAEITDEEENQDEEETSDDSKSDLEKLLSGVKPLDETEEEIKTSEKTIEETPVEEPEEENVDLTLEKLASEFIQTQDKIVEEAKAATPGKISKLRRFVPFKKKQASEDNVFGDLFGWAGQAANDDEFSVPGFFTRNASKK